MLTPRLALLALLAATPARAQESIGPWEIVATPIAVTPIQPIGYPGGWLHVDPVPVTFGAIFTGFPLLDDGYGNPSNFHVEFESADGVLVNRAGSDLLLIEARYDAGLFQVSTELDGFSTWANVEPNDFSDTGLDRDYYYQRSPPGVINPCDVYAAPFDLSRLDVPFGATVRRIQMRCTLRGDPIGVGVLDGSFGVAYCSSAPNSTGAVGALEARVSRTVMVNDLTLFASGLPLHSAGLFLVAQSVGSSTPAGSQGVLCLGNPIGSLRSAVRTTGSIGSFEAGVDLLGLPLPAGPVAVQPGETWRFQAWHRDLDPGPTTHFTSAIEVTFD